MTFSLILCRPHAGRHFCIFSASVIYQSGPDSRVFCTIDISVRTGQLLDGGEREWEKKRATGDGRAQKITGGTVNVTGIIEIFPVLPLLHPRFLCKSLKYTSCTVFRSKFIHYGNDVKSGQKISAIFVRFLPLSLQFASFFFFLPLVLYLYTTDALQRRPCKKMFST